MPPPPPPLTEELVEEILLRLPPQEPASLVRAALVCKPWRRLVSGRRFRRRFLEFHRTPPMLGFLCNHHSNCSSFVRTGTAAASSPLHAKSPRRIALDARHGRVLLWDYTGRRRNVLELVVWDPISDERRRLPIPPRTAMSSTTAAVLCAGAGDCDHFDCHRGPFLVVLVGTDPGNMFVCTYSSDAAAWSDPIPTQRPNGCYNQAGYSPSVLLGNSLYFGISTSSAALKFNLELREVSWVQLPALRNCLQRSVLTTTEDGGLGLVTIGDSDGASRLCVWLRKEEDTPKANAGWTQSKAIDLWRLLPVDSHSTVVGFADGLNIVFVRVDVDGALYTIDLKTYMVKEVYRGTGVHTVFPYMSFCLPGVAYGFA